MPDRDEVRAAWPTLSPRERDALVARAAGWTRVCHESRPAGWPPQLTFGVPPGEAPANPLPQVPRYDEWAEAGRLLEELAKLPGVCWVELDSPGELIEWWCVELHDEEGEPLLDTAFGETARSAIALAYVLAKLLAEVAP